MQIEGYKFSGIRSCEFNPDFSNIPLISGNKMALMVGEPWYDDLTDETVIRVAIFEETYTGEDHE